MSAPGRSSRLWEIDVLRAVAMAMMVAYHLAYDVHFLAPSVDIDPFDGGWRALQVATGSTFLALVGVSYWIADRGARADGAGPWGRWRRGARRGAVVLCAAAAVSLATRIALGSEDYVRFGILHLIATLMIVVLPAVVALGRWNAPLGAAVIAAGLIIRDVEADMPAGLIIGFAGAEAGVDWYPLAPWAGAALLGIAAAAVAYPDGRRASWLQRGLLAYRSPAPALQAAGRHSLPFYLIHQPVLVLLTAGALAALGVNIEWS